MNLGPSSPPPFSSLHFCEIASSGQMNIVALRDNIHPPFLSPLVSVLSLFLPWPWRDGLERSVSPPIPYSSLTWPFLFALSLSLFPGQIHSAAEPASRLEGHVPARRGLPVLQAHAGQRAQPDAAHGDAARQAEGRQGRVVQVREKEGRAVTAARLRTGEK